MERIGFIGLGSMGKPMAHNLMKAVYPVSVLTRTRSKIEDLLAEGAMWCSTPKEIAQKNDVVITMLPVASKVRELMTETLKQTESKRLRLIDYYSRHAMTTP